MQLRPRACLEVRGIKVLVSNSKVQMLDLYRYLGVDPAQMKLLVNKSSVHFRAAFAPIASAILVAMAANPGDLPWMAAEVATRP